jgi:hypothetical protein
MSYYVHPDHRHPDFRKVFNTTAGRGVAAAGRACTAIQNVAKKELYEPGVHLFGKFD